MTCIFCEGIKPEQVIYETDHIKVVYDIDPIQTGHLLLIAKDHYMSLAELPVLVRHEWIDLEVYLVGLMEETLRIDGVTRASNDKRLMDGGTHFHSHLIPRQAEDGFWDKVEVEGLTLNLATFETALRDNKRG